MPKTLFNELRRFRLFVSTAALFSTTIATYFAWQHFWPVENNTAWSYDVYLDGIPMVSALAIDRQNNLYVSQEFRNGKGLIFKQAPDGTHQNILTQLSKPDGLAVHQNGIVASQEIEGGELLWWHDGKLTSLFAGHSIEGIFSDGQTLFAVEDRKSNGRLLKYDVTQKDVQVLRESLSEPEGVAVCPDGRLFFTEKGPGWVKRYTPGAPDDEILIRGLHAPSFLMCNEDGLWITEDLTHQARLLLWDTSGKLQTILSYLRAPQTIIAAGPNRYLLAEQGRGRILELRRHSDAQH